MTRKQAFNQKWVEDLVLVKAFVGLRIQEAVLKKVAKLKETTYRLSTAAEESKGIDGFIGESPVSVKPITYKTKNMLNEEIKAKIIFYEKKKDSVLLDLSALD